MSRARLLSLCGFLGSILLSLTTDSSPIVDRPLHSAAFILAVTGITILWLNRTFPNVLQSAPSEQIYSILPHDERRSSRDASQGNDDRVASGGTGLILFLSTLVVAAACVRLELLRRTLKDTQCSQVGIQCVLPLLIALFDSWRTRSSAKNDLEIIPEYRLRSTVVRVFKDNRTRYLLPALLLTWGSVLNALSTSRPRSTHICAIALPHRILIPVFQSLGVLLDTFILCAIASFSKGMGARSIHKYRRWPMMVAWIFLVIALSLTVAGAIVYSAKPEYRSWIVSLDDSYLLSLMGQTLLTAPTIISGMVLLLWFDLLEICFLVFFVCTSVPSFTAMWTETSVYPSVARGTIFFSLLLLFCGLAIFRQVRTGTESHVPLAVQLKAPSFRPLLYGFLLSFFALYALLQLYQSQQVSFHPIDVLMDGAKILHNERWRNVSQSNSLDTAVTEYRRRYHRHPPPGYDEWYKFATDRSSLIINEFDSIDSDLSPFWSLSPTELRFRVWQMNANPWNEIAGISVRAGKAEISPNILPTHRWMLEGATRMINTFAEWLPDMDLALNLNDECRVAVPWERLVIPRRGSGGGENASSFAAFKENKWSSNREDSWPPLPSEPITETVFEDHSFHDTFYKYGAIGCPPPSRARKERAWNTRDLCVSCAAPHSLGQYVQNWTLAADICHQPDLAKLHGFYVSPAAFKTTHDLMPVFSQSKVHGYSDILFPSPWNYIDKVKYDPSPEHPDKGFHDKSSTLFWRGATSEGVSAEGTWKGMTRQRLVHLANNLTSSEEVPVMLQTPSHKYAYRGVKSKDLRKLLNMDIGIVDKIARCGGRDCADQEKEFGLVGQSDFQDHWKYRYLFDMDGAGFSGRFLPFLQSKSLPFKTALFREWYDSRLTAWLHFVPQDLRLQGVHSTLAYFSGINGKIDGKQVFMPAHAKEGEFIAEQGREWANKVLRKEDMEVYFFRLLLEWGRLTDERRDDIGFQL
ncbi:MAG: hypothetical protein M1812_003181 [Candelaria pacifica]|nr:MAG: hypothetical protein M1812_003181 [Candelaria pacifica]